METNKLTKKNKITMIIGIVLFLILVLSASYAYFAITSVNNATTTTITGNGESLGTPTLTTNTTSLSLTLTSELMASDINSVDKRIYSSTNGKAIIEDGKYSVVSGITTPVTLGNGRYVLATASVAGGDINYNCTYNFDVSASVTKTITDGSDQDVHVIVTSPKGETFRYRLDQLLDGTKTISGIITNLIPGENQEFTIESYVYNQNMVAQDDLSGNSYTISVSPKSGTQGFSCSATTTPISTGFADSLIKSGKLWNSGFDGDGYRFIGTNSSDQICSYNNGSVFTPVTNNACPTIYNIIEKDPSSGEIVNEIRYTQEGTSLSENETATSFTGTKLIKKVDNYVCFGTTNKSDCTSNADKYMYRIVGVFPDDYGNQHIKLVKDKTIGTYAYHSSVTKPVDWQDTDLYKGLNGSYFYTNTTYDYMQNSSWRAKISDWRWVSSRAGNANRELYHKFEYPMSYSNRTISESTKIYTEEIYLHEMNKSTKRYKQGYWTYNTAKIGLLNASDYYLTLGLSSESDDIQTQHLSWLNNTTGSSMTYYWTISTNLNTIGLAGYTYGFRVSSTGNQSSLGARTATSTINVTPAFYLNSDVELGSGTGASTDPYILK